MKMDKAVSFGNMLKYAVGIVATIFLGALGSGLWEIVVSPLLNYSYTASGYLMASIYSGYFDDIYKSAALIKVSTSETRSLVLALCGIVILFKLTKLSYLFDFYKARYFKGSPLFIKYYFSIIGLVLLTTGYFSLIKTSLISSVKTYSYTSMEILRPYIGEREYILLISEFHRIESKSTFDAFDEKIVKYSKEYDINLPDKI